MTIDLPLTITSSERNGCYADVQPEFARHHGPQP